MKAGIYTPYLDSLGGGERYMMTIAETLAHHFSVDVFLDSHLFSLDTRGLKDQLSSRFNLNLSKIRFIKAPVGKNSSMFERLFFLRGYDYFFYLTDGSFFYSTAKNSILHLQSPISLDFEVNIWDRLKLSSWKKVIYNSHFTEYWTKEKLKLKGQVIYPPVDVEKISPAKKEKIILSVGRFNSFLKSKKHEEMIRTFSKLYSSNQIKGWKLALVGSVEGDYSYLEELKKMASGLPIFFYPDMEFKELIKLYGRASIYWHLAGYQEEDPKKMEHFGITTAEAMAGGCVPVVIASGGQLEIVEDGKSGFLWHNLGELKEITIKLSHDAKLLAKISESSIKRSKFFSKEKFKSQILRIVGL